MKVMTTRPYEFKKFDLIITFETKADVENILAYFEQANRSTVNGERIITELKEALK